MRNREPKSLPFKGGGSRKADEGFNELFVLFCFSIVCLFYWIAIDKRKILKYVYPTYMYVYVPKNNDIGYDINCEFDFEEEHGISWTVRNDEIIFLSCNGDVDSPWSDNGELAYKKQKAVKRINPQNICTVEKAMELVQKGDLQAVERIPEKGGDDNIIFVPEVIAEWKQKQDIMVELMRVKHEADEYFCEVKYNDDSVVPCSLTVSAEKDGKNVFLMWIEIWHYG